MTTTTTTAFDPRAIGGSSAASCVGVGFESGLALWQRLRGDESQVRRWTREQKRLLSAGLALEPIVRDAVREDYGTELLMHPDEVRHPQHDRIVGHLDAWIEPGRIGAEIKVVSGYGQGWGELDTDEIPRGYVVQCAHYMMLTGAREWHVFAARLPSWRVDRYIVRRDQAVCDALLARELHMLALVDEGTPPDPADEAEARALFFRHAEGVTAQATPEVRAAVMRLALARRVQAAAAGVISDATATILRHARDAEWLVEGKDKLLRMASNRTFDEPMFRARYPELVQDCIGFVGSRAREMHRKAYESCLRQPGEPGESPRVLRITPELAAAIDRMVESPATITSMIPEVLSLKESAQ